RARGAPALEAWCATLLGSASAYRCTVRYTRDGGVVATRAVGLDELPLSALDLVRAARAGELAAYVLDHARGGPAGATPVIDAARIGARSLDDAELLGAALGDVLARARPAQPGDVAATDQLAPAALTELAGRASDGLLDDALAQLARDPAPGLRAAAAL